MKILIIGTPRSGTSTLNLGLGKCLNIEIIGEPFNFSIPNRTHKDLYRTGKPVLPDNCVLKTIIGQLPIEKHNTPWDEFYDEFISYFDKLIFLSRKDKHKMLESFAFAVDSGFWHDKWSKTYDINYKEYEKMLLGHSNYLLELAKRNNKEVFWYEDLYSDNEQTIKLILNKWDIPGLTYEDLYQYINTKNKYRQDDNFNKRLI